MNIDISRYKMTEEDLEKFRKFKKDGNKYLEKEGKEYLTFMWTDPFAGMLQRFHMILEKINFSKPFQIVVDYDPEQKRTLVHHYAPEYQKDII